MTAPVVFAATSPRARGLPPGCGATGSRDTPSRYAAIPRPQLYVEGMAMTLRLSPAEDETLARLARQFRMSKNAAAAQAIEAAGPRADHPDFVRAATLRLLDRYSDLVDRLAQA